MNCSEWVKEEEAILQMTTMPQKEIGASMPIVMLSVHLRCQFQPSRIPPEKVFYKCLKHFLAVEKHTDIQNGEVRLLVTLIFFIILIFI